MIVSELFPFSEAWSMVGSADLGSVPTPNPTLVIFLASLAALLLLAQPFYKSVKYFSFSDIHQR
ncbi:MAG: hypothetical protein KTR14_01845 [Vampirovibrio sp.]|nr:hypothetical protein [Vampirovibrio sp.]